MLLGAQLRRLREAAGMPPEKAGYEIRASRSKISRMETGQVRLKLRDIEDLLTLYGVTDEKQRAKIIALARRSREREWWIQYNDILPEVVPFARGGHAGAGGSFAPSTWTSARTSSTTSRSPTSSAARL
jgi:transcriptional regulator with XRE-family HTH domain